MTFWCPTYFFKNVFSPRPPRQKTPELWQEICCHSSFLHPLIFKEPKPCDTPIHQSLAQKGLQDERKAKKWVSSNLCHALVALSALWPVCIREQQKSPLENDMWRQAKFLSQLNSAQVKQSLCWKQFISSLWLLAAAQRKVQGDCSVPLYILHLASSKSSGEKKNVIYIRFWLLRTHAWRDMLTASHSWFLHEVRAALVDEESLFCS